MSTNAEFMANEISAKLAGWTIVQATVDSPDPYAGDQQSFGFVVGRRNPKTKLVERKTVWVDCDAEGNGPGWLNMEDG